VRKCSVKGVNGVEFVKYVESVSVATEGGLVEYVIEHRVDPLTKHVSRINPFRYMREAEAASRPVETASECPFCTPKVLRITPLPRSTRGNSVAFPNLYPFSAHHLVVVPNASRHLMGLEEISAEDLADAFHTIYEYFRGNYSRNRELKFVYINMNFLPTAGASQPHLHLQVFQEPRPTEFHRELLLKSLGYMRKFNANYWLDLVKSEEEVGERFIRRYNSCVLLSSFSPLLNGEVVCVFDVDSLFDLDPGDLAKVVAKTLKVYSELFKSHGVNLAIFDTGFYRKSISYFKPQMRLVVRKKLAELYANDVGFMELFHREPIVVIPPEKLADDLRSSFKGELTP